MGQTKGLLLLSSDGLRLIDGDGRQPARSLEVAIGQVTASQIQEVVQLPRRTWNLVLALSADLVVACSLPPDIHSPSGRPLDTRRLAFAVEEYLPWAAEEIAAVSVAPTTSSLVVATCSDQLRPLLAAIGPAAGQVSAIVPEGFLRLEALLQGTKVPQDSPVVIQTDRGVELFVRRAGVVQDWRYWPCSRDGLTTEQAKNIAREVVAMEMNQNLVAYGAEERLQLEFQNLGILISQAMANDSESDALLMQGARSCWSRRCPLPNLAVGALAGNSLDATAAQAFKTMLSLLILLTVLASAILWWKSTQLEDSLIQVRGQQEQLFREAFPGVPVPTAITVRINSEYRQVVGTRGGGGAITLPLSPLTGLQIMLEAHTGPMRSRFEEVFINDRVLELECEFRSNDEAGQMVARLEGLGVRIEPPQLQALDERRIGTRLRGHITPDRPGVP